jgi:hypothetical protein
MLYNLFFIIISWPSLSLPPCFVHCHPSSPYTVFYVAQTKICVFKLKLSENISSYIIITYMFRLCFCLCCFSSGCLNIKWTKFSPSSSLYICRDLFHFCPAVVVVDRCGCMYVHIFLGCLVFGYFEAHTSDGHSSIN